MVACRTFCDYCNTGNTWVLGKLLWPSFDAIHILIEMSYSKNVQPCECNMAFQARWFYCSKLEVVPLFFLSAMSYSMHFFLQLGLNGLDVFVCIGILCQLYCMLVVSLLVVLWRGGQGVKPWKDSILVARRRLICLLLCSVNPCRPINSSLKSLPPWSFSLKYSTYLSRNSNTIQSHSGLQEFFPGCKNHNLLRKDTN